MSKFKQIGLIWPKSTFLNDPVQYPPLGLWYLSSRLESFGHHTEFFDLSFDELPNDGDFDQLWISSTSPQILDVRRIESITKNWTKTKTVLGGAGSWASPETHKKLSFNLIVGGEADYPENTQLILDTLEYHPETHYILLPNPKGLEWVCPPNRKWATKYHGYMNDQSGNRYRMMSAFLSRGCAFHCQFCESSSHGIIWSRTTRYEPIWSVEHQLKEAIELGFTGINYYDDVYIMNKRRTLEILEIHKKYDLKWRCFLRSDILSKHGGFDYLKQMKDSGLIEVFVGIESADNKMKEGITKGTTILQDENVLKWCRELGITFKGSFILGLPGESRESMEMTRNWILKQDPNGIRIQVGRLIPFSGTPLGDHPENYDLSYDKQLDEEWFYKGNVDSHSFVSTSHLSRDEIDDFWRKLDVEMKEAGFRS